MVSVISDYYWSYLSQQEYLMTRLSEIKGMLRGNLKVAISEGVAEMMVHEILVTFYASYLGIHVELTTDSVNSIVEKFRTDVVYLGVCFKPPEHGELSVLKKVVQSVGVVFRSDHRLGDTRQPFLMKDALRYPYAMMTQDYGLRRYLSLIEFQHKVKFDVGLTKNSLQVLKQFVLSGAGVALMSSPGLWDKSTQEKILLSSIEDVTLPPPEVFASFLVKLVVTDGCGSSFG